MNIEYIGISQAQQTEGKRQLLYSHMELLNALKHYALYKKFRKQELALKNLLKRKISEAHEEIAKLDGMLPKLKTEAFRPAELSKVTKRRSDLEQEIEDIKRKISELQ